MLKKIFGGIRMTWPKLILFSLISGFVTALIALLVPEGNSIRQAAVTFEAWIVLAILIVVNCEKPLEAACKTFVFFLISQPLVYLVQVPFSSMGFGLFKFYPYWFYWTLATFPGAFIAWFIKRDDIPAALILSVALGALILFGAGYLRDLLRRPPKFLIATLFCFGSVPLLILCVLKSRAPRLTAGIISVAAAAALIIYMFAGPGIRQNIEMSFGLDREQYPVTEEWTVRMEDPEKGTCSIFLGDDVISDAIRVTIYDAEEPSDIILTDPEGNEYRFPAEIRTDGNGNPTVIY